MDVETTFDNRCTAAFSVLDEYQRRLRFANKKMKDLGSKAFPSERLNSVIKNLSNILELSNEGLFELDNLLLELPPSIEWIPETSLNDFIEMSWSTGVTPWYCWLKFQHQTSDIKEVLKLIKEKWQNGELESVQFPTVGMFVAICSKRRTYRGVITAISSKLQVVNVDEGKEHSEDFESCFKLMREFCELHANSIHCSIDGDNLEELWKKKHFQEFLDMVQDNDLSMKIIKHNSSNVIPLYVIELNVYDEDKDEQVSIRRWIAENFEVPVAQQEKSDVNRTLPEDLITSSHNSNVKVKTENINPPLVSRQQFPSALNTSENTPMKVIRIRSEQNIPSAVMNGHVEGENRFLKIAQMVDRTFVSQKNDVGSVLKKYESTNLNLNAPEFQPVKKERSHCPAAKVPAVVNGEDSVLPGFYVPQDDRRLCQFFATRGFCWKVGCRREHKRVANGKWTDDKAELYTETFTDLTMPKVGEELSVYVTNVISPNTCYINLPDSYSGSTDGETIKNLRSALNDVSTCNDMKLLASPPSFGEIIISFCDTLKQWARATVINICDEENIQVFFMDNGITEEVNLSHCRQIPPEFNHLSGQAVLCVLNKVSQYAVGENDESRGTELLVKFILHKTIQIQIIDSDEDANRLEVVAHFNGTNINELLIKKGYSFLS